MVRRLTLAPTVLMLKRTEAHPNNASFHSSDQDLERRTFFLNTSVGYLLNDNLFRRATGETLRFRSLNHLTLDFMDWGIEADESINVYGVTSTHPPKNDTG